MNCGYGHKVKEIAHQIIVRTSENEFENFENFAKELVGKVAESVTAGEGLISSKAQDLIWMEFHRIRTDVGNKEKWTLFLTSLNIITQDIVSSLLFQYVLRAILCELIMHQSTKFEEEKNVPNNHSDHDMQVLRYIAGFIPFSLLKRFNRSKSEQARHYTEILKEWQLNGENNIVAPSFLTYTVTWINLQNRGGLFKVHDDAFRFFLTLERVSKSLLQKKELTKMNTINLNQMMKTKIAACPNVSKTWNDITINSKVSTKGLYNAVVSKWIKLRINAFVKAFNILKKQQKQASKKGERSLRKELQT